MQEKIDKLAALDPITYSQQRGDVAKYLGVSKGALDAAVKAQRKISKAAHSPGLGVGEILQPVEPWPEPVQGDHLPTGILAVLNRFMILPPGAAAAVAFWIIFSHAHDAFDNSPILAIQSPEKRCGKTLLELIIGQLVPKPLPAANITTAAVFRSIGKWIPTLLLDEVETFIRDNEEMRGVLNSGFTRAAAYVIRTEGDNFEPRAFPTWCPKVAALIGELPDTLQDRSIVVTLRRKLPNEQVERFSAVNYGALHELRAKIARWAKDNIESLRGASPVMPNGLNDRAEDSWRPLLAIADAVGGIWSTEARTAAVQISGELNSDASASTGALLLLHLREVFDAEQRMALASTELVRLLTENESWPWAEWRHGGRPITPHWLARTLKRYNIGPRKGRHANEYWAEDFADAFGRYLSPLKASEFQSSTPPPDGKMRRNFNMSTSPEGLSESSTKGGYVELSKTTQAIDSQQIVEVWNFKSEKEARDKTGDDRGDLVEGVL